MNYQMSVAKLFLLSGALLLSAEVTQAQSLDLDCFSAKQRVTQVCIFANYNGPHICDVTTYYGNVVPSLYGNVIPIGLIKHK